MLGRPVDLSRAEIDSYVVAGIADHICPWTSCYSSVHLLGGRTRFVLSTSGHIAALVNPPGNPKASYRVAEGDLPGDPQDFLAGVEPTQGSWWTDFVEWCPPIPVRTNQHRLCWVTPRTRSWPQPPAPTSSPPEHRRAPGIALHGGGDDAVFDWGVMPGMIGTVV